MSKKYTKVQTEETVNEEVSMEELENAEVVEGEKSSKKKTIKKVAFAIGGAALTFALGCLCGSKTKKSSNDGAEVVYEDEDVTVVDLPSED